MLQLKNIYKEYKTGDFVQAALENINISFRKREFVAILGPSGSGKTTLLNIMGGLDQSDRGCLIINGVSTENYTDKNWDSYRNQYIGFVFQNYNLIEHQNILSNVELALTLSGMSEKEREKRAINALTQVGLEQHIYKKPNQLSGGQMQRVAIARALVNNPEIILADEPTGALDSENSYQIMELLKEVSKNRLVIMVTHNQELAMEYATRIVHVVDGSVLSDDNPYREDATVEMKMDLSRSKKTSLSFRTACSLSFQNLCTKKARTMITAFAGSIGIIGIALILALSNGVQQFISNVEEETLTSYPITIESQGIDLNSMISSIQDSEELTDYEPGKVYSNNILSDTMELMSTEVKQNNLKKLKEYIEENSDRLDEYVSDIQYQYDVQPQIYRENEKGEIQQVNPSSVLEKMGIGSGNGVCFQLSDQQEMLDSQYEILKGRWPEQSDEIILAVNGNGQISDVSLYALGILDESEFDEKIEAVQNGEKLEKEEVHEYSYDELMNQSFRMIYSSDCYTKEVGIWQSQSDNEEYMDSLYDQAKELKVVGIVQVRDEDSLSVSTGLGYTSDLTRQIVQHASESEIVKEQKAKTDIDIFTGNSFSGVTEGANTYKGNLALLGSADLDSPASIHIYAKDFEAKEEISDFISEYNASLTEDDEEYEIQYTDYTALLMKYVTKIVNMISYVLIAFVSISLIVSSIMIGIITYISVLERTKEIGILRSMGASKKDVSNVFYAETFIIGLASGCMGIGISALAIIPANYFIEKITGIECLAVLPWKASILLILLSMILTVLAGMIPARIAAKKDPVKALRSE